MKLESEVSELQLFQDTINLNGVDSQLDQVQEECLELALAIRKYKRAKEEVKFIEEFALAKRRTELISEIADVSIMMAQCFLIFDKSEIDPEIKRKLEKHQDWLNKKINSLI